jgi:hypothetical protein
MLSKATLGFITSPLEAAQTKHKSSASEEEERSPWVNQQLPEKPGSPGIWKQNSDHFPKPFSILMQREDRQCGFRERPGLILGLGLILIH